MCDQILSLAHRSWTTGAAGIITWVWSDYLLILFFGKNQQLQPGRTDVSVKKHSSGDGRCVSRDMLLLQGCLDTCFMWAEAIILLAQHSHWRKATCFTFSLCRWIWRQGWEQRANKAGWSKPASVFSQGGCPLHCRWGESQLPEAAQLYRKLWENLKLVRAWTNMRGNQSWSNLCLFFTTLKSCGSFVKQW